ncbi:hypothetical protein FGA82_31955, partial [Pseudomonas fluorescens]
MHSSQALPNPCRSCRRLRSFDLWPFGSVEEQDQKIAAFGSSYRSVFQIKGRCRRHWIGTALIV